MQPEIPKEFREELFFKKIEALKDEGPEDFSHLKENVHYYFDEGLLVFTELYHKRRGTCCDSGCRHCPFESQKNLDL